MIKGVVQGVGFRASCIYRARNISGLQGWVRNLTSGDVEVLVQGEPAHVQKLVDWCYQGPSRSKVESVEEFEEKVDPKLQAFGV